MTAYTLTATVKDTKTNQTATLPAVFMVNSVKPVFGTNKEATWSVVSTALGGIRAYRAYDTPSVGIPPTWPGSSAAPIPSGSLPMISIRPDIPSVISGSLDSQLVAFAKLVPAGAWVTCWSEGEAANKGYTAAQITGLHNRVYPIFKANSPNCLYGQMFTTYSATNGRITPFTATGLDYYGLDVYPWTTTDTPAANISMTITQIKAAGATGPFAVTEINVTAGNGAPVASMGSANWFTQGYAYAKSINMLAYVPYWLPSLVGCNWPPDSATITALSVINADSKS
jgi:hypothetical protein